MPWRLAGCPITPFLPPWCLPFLPLWCLPGASQAVQKWSFQHKHKFIIRKLAGNRDAMAAQQKQWAIHLDRQYADRVQYWSTRSLSNGSFLPPWCLANCPISPFLPPWCLPGASQAVQMALSCLPGASQAVQRALSCLPGASQAVQLVLSGLPGASQAVQMALSYLPGAPQAVQLVLSCLPGASLAPRGLSNSSFFASLVLLWCLLGCPNDRCLPPKSNLALADYWSQLVLPWQITGVIWFCLGRLLE